MPILKFGGYKYGVSGEAGTGGGTVTWAIDTTVPTSFASTLTTAFNTWSSSANIQFKQVDPSTSPKIVISLASIDGPGGTIGRYDTNYQPTSSPNVAGSLGVAKSSKIVFDKDENWHVAGNGIVSNNGSTLLATALTEIGFSIGLSKSMNADSVMSLHSSTLIEKLGSGDIQEVVYMYGTAPKAWFLVDQNFYNAANPDVAPSPISAMEHYNSYGWHEDRNPNAHFSTTGYLAANMDVARNGLNPLTHYDQYGWKEGRDPSANFDNELYLAHNPDVKAAGIDPLIHYLQSGKAEGRQIYDAIGRASSFNHGSFDAEYYLLANPDVAKAALNAGNDSFAFAYRHFDTYGWKEGRKADAFFDPAYYIAKNPDVAAANIDPLTHYDAYGWKEGRNPSASFDTHAYLAANPDVAAAHIDPLLHYLQFGANEGRHLV